MFFLTTILLTIEVESNQKENSVSKILSQSTEQKISMVINCYNSHNKTSLYYI
jgi:hypothetical protein